MADLIMLPNGNSSNMNNHGDDSNDEHDGDPEITLASILSSKTISFPISANYTKWEPREAFRELVQNWRDGIIESFKIPEADFSVERNEKKTGRNTEIIYQVPAPSNLIATGGPEWLGYIRFRGRDGEGTVEIVNCSATLQPWHLDMGGTSKAGNKNQAGAHGEGLKLALLVLMRVTHLRRMSPSSIQQAESQGQRLMKTRTTMLPFVAKAKSDVMFVIGEAARGRNERGQSVGRSPVKQQQFEHWTTAALFLDTAHGAMIHKTTDAGSLLTGQHLRGKIYLKGLLLQESTAWQSASLTGRELRYGYDFPHGKTNRERMSLASASQESRAIHAIWDANPRLDYIIRGLGYQGVELTEPYWDILRKHNLVRTAEEQESKLFKAAPGTDVPKTSFATGVCNLLGACLKACREVKDYTICFVQAKKLDLHIFLSEEEILFRIHDRWLTKKGAVNGLGLRGAMTEADLIYNAVRFLFADALKQLPLEVFTEVGGGYEDGTHDMTPVRRRKLQVNLAERRLLNYLRIDKPTVEIVIGLARLSSWKGEHVESGLDEGKDYFFSLAMEPSDPGSFVSVSEVHRCRHHAPEPSASRGTDSQGVYNGFEMGPELLELDIMNIKGWHAVKRNGTVYEFRSLTPFYHKVTMDADIIVCVVRPESQRLVQQRMQKKRLHKLLMKWCYAGYGRKRYFQTGFTSPEYLQGVINYYSSMMEMESNAEKNAKSNDLKNDVDDDVDNSVNTENAACNENENRSDVPALGRIYVPATFHLSIVRCFRSHSDKPLILDALSECGGMCFDEIAGRLPYRLKHIKIRRARLR
ncbi:MAG: hypothetical protein STHCBS139747_002272 [Sporothrix thermara]